MQSYSIPAPVLQGVIAVLEEIPAKASRQLLNALEAAIEQQNREAAAKLVQKDETK